MSAINLRGVAFLLALTLMLPWFFTPPFTFATSSVPLAATGTQVDCEDHLCGG